ncbi:short-chain dehydrogenase, partial [Providencia vermicola]|nr:short-chain dehydrogenase [Providencia vermicola]
MQTSARNKKSILVTGASSGIGFCAAQTPTPKRGYHVIAACRKESDILRLQA